MLGALDRDRHTRRCHVVMSHVVMSHVCSTWISMLYWPLIGACNPMLRPIHDLGTPFTRHAQSPTDRAAFFFIFFHLHRSLTHRGQSTMTMHYDHALTVTVTVL